MSIKDFLKSVYFFGNLKEDYYEEIAKISELKNVKKDEIIFSEGEKAKGFYIVKEGKIKIFKISFEGKEHILHIFEKGEPFGEAPAFIEGKFPANASSLENSELLFFEKEKFFSLLKKIPEISIGIIGVLSKRLHNFTTIIENLSLKEVPARLGGYLLYLDNKRDKKGDFFKLNMSKKYLANFLGTTPETLSRIFFKLKEKKLIEEKGNRIRIIDYDTIKDIADGIITLKEV